MINAGILAFLVLLQYVLGEEMIKIPISGLKFEEIPPTAEKSLGVIKYKPDIQQAIYEITDDHLAEKTCLKAAGIPNSDCFAVVDDLSDKQFVIQLNQHNNIEYLTVQTFDVQEKTRGKKDPQLVANGIRQRVVVKHAQIVPEPNLNPSNVAKTAKKPVKTESEEEEAPKSWLQQNWMYIVPPLLIMFVMLGDDK